MVRDNQDSGGIGIWCKERAREVCRAKGKVYRLEHNVRSRPESHAWQNSIKQCPAKVVVGNVICIMVG